MFTSKFITNLAILGEASMEATLAEEYLNSLAIGTIKTFRDIDKIKLEYKLANLNLVSKLFKLAPVEYLVSKNIKKVTGCPCTFINGTPVLVAYITIEFNSGMKITFFYDKYTKELYLGEDFVFTSLLDLSKDLNILSQAAEGYILSDKNYAYIGAK